MTAGCLPGGARRGEGTRRGGGRTLSPNVRRIIYLAWSRILSCRSQSSFNGENASAWHSLTFRGGTAVRATGWSRYVKPPSINMPRVSRRYPRRRIRLPFGQHQRRSHSPRPRYGSVAGGRSRVCSGTPSPHRLHSVSRTNGCSWVNTRRRTSTEL